MTTIGNLWYNSAGAVVCAPLLALKHQKQAAEFKEPDSISQTIAENVALVREKIARAESRAGRPAQSVRLIAVTKTVEAARIGEAMAVGVQDVGENYIQEGRDKFFAVQALELAQRPTWHFIGSLQRNKAKFAVAQYDLIHSVDSVALAQEIGRRAEKQGKTAQKILLEVRLGAEPGAGETQRAGFAPETVLEAAGEIAQIAGVDVRGLMAIAPADATGAEAARPYFAQVRALWEQLPPANRHELSMGMTNDFEAAIAHGATLIRIGTALFGRRGT